jgi:DNA polymerase-3 subunit epsilon
VSTPVGFAVVDVETNGLSAQTHRVLEVGCVQLRPDLAVEDTWSTLVNPGTSDMGRVDIHHIHPGDVRAAPPFAAIAGDLVARLRGRILVGHNINFDVGFLNREFDRAGVAIDFSTVPGIDTVDLARQRWPGLPANLPACCRRAQVPGSGTHSALADALATGALLRYLLRHAMPGTAQALRHAAQRAEFAAWPSLPVAPTPLLPRRLTGKTDIDPV